MRRIQKVLFVFLLISMTAACSKGRVDTDGDIISGLGPDQQQTQQQAQQEEDSQTQTGNSTGLVGTWIIADEVTQIECEPPGVDGFFYDLIVNENGCETTFEEEYSDSGPGNTYNETCTVNGNTVVITLAYFERADSTCRIDYTHQVELTFDANNQVLTGSSQGSYAATGCTPRTLSWYNNGQCAFEANVNAEKF